MQVANSQSVKSCHWGGKSVVAQTPLIGYFVRDAKRYPEVRFSFEESHLTHFGGIWIIQRFCKRLKLRWLLQKYMDKLRRTGTYHPAELILARLLLPAPVPRCVATLRKFAAASTVPNLQMTGPCFSSEAGRKMPSFAHF